MRELTRSELIDELRAQLLQYVDDEHSICEVAEQLGIFCGGFGQWTFQELKTRHPTIVRSRRRITPQELRDLANRWQIVRQQVLGGDIACDTQMCEGELRLCHGWDEWRDEDLAGFLEELTGEEVGVVARTTAPSGDDA